MEQTETLTDSQREMFTTIVNDPQISALRTLFSAFAEESLNNSLEGLSDDQKEAFFNMFVIMNTSIIVTLSSIVERGEGDIALKFIQKLKEDLGNEYKNMQNSNILREFDKSVGETKH
jgi:hypothetical protein